MVGGRGRGLGERARLICFLFLFFKKSPSSHFISFPPPSLQCKLLSRSKKISPVLVQANYA